MSRSWQPALPADEARMKELASNKPRDYGNADAALLLSFPAGRGCNAFPAPGGHRLRAARRPILPSCTPRWSGGANGSAEQEFLDLLGAANLIPGPTSTELAIYLGFRRVGWIGLVLAGVCFILPAMLIVLALAWAYVRFGSTPLASGIF